MNKQVDHKITDLEIQHRLFIPEEKDLKDKFFLGIWYRAQVPSGQMWLVYRDGVFHEALKAGPHALWNALWHKWKVHVINLRTVDIPFVFEGRVQGPPMSPSERSAAGVDLGCSVEADVVLACKIADAEKYLEYERPLTIFYASLRNMVVETIDELPYDQFGKWAVKLRDRLRERLQGGRNDSERLIGMRVEEVYVTSVEPNSLQDRNMMTMYQQVERVRRELAEAQANRQRDAENARSFADQGAILNIAPSILALQNSPIGKELLTRDADLRKMMVAAGLNPGVSVQPIRDPQAQVGSAPTAGYLNLPPQQNTGPIGTTNTFPHAVSGSLVGSGGQSSPTWPNTPPPPAASAADVSALDPSLQDRELGELQTAGFQCAGRGQFVPTYDSNGQPKPGTTEWVIEAYIQRINGFITVILSCPAAYPSVPPRVQMRTPANASLKGITPDVVRTWNPNRMLVEIVQEIDNNTP